AGFDAIALALARGYSLQQIVKAALTGRLRSSGEIVARAGGTEPPSGPAVHIFADAPAPAEPAPTQGQHLPSLEGFQAARRKPAGDLGISILVLILLLREEGYTMDQIVLGLFFGDQDIAIFDDHLRLVERLSGGHQQVEPGDDPGHVFADCGNGRVEADEQCDGYALGDSWGPPSIGLPSFIEG